MVILLTIVHILICVFLVIVVLLQSGKAADLAGAFGGMGSQTAFGPRGSATVLSKATTIAAALFMVTSLSLAILATRGAGSATSVVEKSKGKAVPATAAKPPIQVPGQQAPAKPGEIQVTPSVNGRPGQTQTIKVPTGQPGSNNQVQPQPAAPATTTTKK